MIFLGPKICIFYFLLTLLSIYASASNHDFTISSISTVIDLKSTYSTDSEEDDSDDNDSQNESDIMNCHSNIQETFSVDIEYSNLFPYITEFFRPISVSNFHSLHSDDSASFYLINSSRNSSLTSSTTKLTTRYFGDEEESLKTFYFDLPAPIETPVTLTFHAVYNIDGLIQSTDSNEISTYIESTLQSADENLVKSISWLGQWSNVWQAPVSNATITLQIPISIQEDELQYQSSSTTTHTTITNQEIDASDVDSETTTTLVYHLFFDEPDSASSSQSGISMLFPASGDLISCDLVQANSSQEVLVAVGVVAFMGLAFYGAAKVSALKEAKLNARQDQEKDAQRAIDSIMNTNAMTAGGYISHTGSFVSQGPSGRNGHNRSGQRTRSLSISSPRSAIFVGGPGPRSGLGGGGGGGTRPSPNSPSYYQNRLSSNLTRNSSGTSARSSPSSSGRPQINTGEVSLDGAGIVGPLGISGSQKSVSAGGISYGLASSVSLVSGNSNRSARSYNSFSSGFTHRTVESTGSSIGSQGSLVAGTSIDRVRPASIQFPPRPPPSQPAIPPRPESTPAMPVRAGRRRSIFAISSPLDGSSIETNGPQQGSKIFLPGSSAGVVGRLPTKKQSSFKVTLKQMKSLVFGRNNSSGSDRSGRSSPSMSSSSSKRSKASTSTTTTTTSSRSLSSQKHGSMTILPPKGANQQHDMKSLASNASIVTLPDGIVDLQEDDFSGLGLSNPANMDRDVDAVSTVSSLRSSSTSTISEYSRRESNDVGSAFGLDLPPGGDDVFKHASQASESIETDSQLNEMLKPSSSRTPATSSQVYNQASQPEKKKTPVRRHPIIIQNATVPKSQPIGGVLPGQSSFDDLLDDDENNNNNNNRNHHQQRHIQHSDSTISSISSRRHSLSSDKTIQGLFHDGGSQSKASLSAPGAPRFRNLHQDPIMAASISKASLATSIPDGSQRYQ